MKLSAHFARHSLVAVAALSFLLSSSICAQNVPSAERPLNLLVLGDSILWGQGLKEEHKAWPQVVPLLVDGWINDIDARRLWTASNTPAGIRELAQAKCGAPVEDLLERIAASFPTAHVIITGYSPIISEKTSNDLFMRALGKRLYTPATGTPRISDKELRKRLIAISKEWYDASNEKLASAARSVDAGLTASGSRQRILFAKVEFLPDYAFGSHGSRLWGFDASPLRKL